MAAKKKTETAASVVRLPTELIDRCAKVAAEMTRRTGVEVTVPAVVRAALAKGLDALER